MAKNSRKQIFMDQMKILKAIRVKGTRSIFDIGTDLRMSGPKVRRHLITMKEQGIIVGEAVVADSQAFGFEKFIVHVKLETANTNGAVREALSLQNSLLTQLLDKYEITLVSSYLCHGLYDWVLILEAPELIVVKSAMNTLSRVLNGAVKDIIVDEVLTPVMEQCRKHPQKNIDEMLEVF